MRSKQRYSQKQQMSYRLLTSIYVRVIQHSYFLYKRILAQLWRAESLVLLARLCPLITFCWFSNWKKIYDLVTTSFVNKHDGRIPPCDIIHCYIKERHQLGVMFLQNITIYRLGSLHFKHRFSIRSFRVLYI